MCDLNGKQYTSCIKIAGIPILPPLITESKRLEIQNYRRKAIEIEERLKIKRELASKLAQETPVHKTLESSLAFNCDALNDSRKCEICVPLLDETKKISTLTCNIFDVTEYNDGGVIVFNDFKKQDSDNINLTASTVELDLTNGNDVPKEIVTVPPRLLRSNSYTLESPSPILLEHFKKQADYQPTKRLSFDDSAYKTCETSESQNLSITSRTSSDVESILSVIKQDDHINCTNSVDCDFIPVKSVSKVVKNLAQIHFGEMDQEVALKEILAVMPENYAKDIVDLLERHRNHSCIKSKYKFDDDITKCNLIDIYKQPFSICTDMEDAVKVSDPSSPLPIDLENDDCTTSCDYSLNHSSDSAVAEKLNILTVPNYDVDLDNLQKELRKQWAASILTAAAKGFLVRRLKRTAHVQGLIQTIRDALLCAMSLHTEPMVAIQPCDVELHRRLIQQISAACYEFYDVFFTLTTKDRMKIIAQDRQKLLRPKSVTNSLKHESRKSPSNSRNNSLSVKQKKNLITSFVA